MCHDIRRHQGDSEAEHHHRGEDRVAHPAEHPAADQRRRLVRVDADAPRITHVQLGIDRRGDADDRDHGPGDAGSTCSRARPTGTPRRPVAGSARRRAAAIETMKPTPADHSIEPGRPLIPRNPVDPVRRRCSQLRQPNPSAAKTAKSTSATTGIAAPFVNNRGHPRQALNPSRTAIAAIPSAAMGSAHAQPNNAFNVQTHQQRR